MRVISGKYKGRRLVAPDNYDIRPTSDKVKESIFSTIQGEVKDGVVLDLFSGTGSLGIEALSRGAKKVYFCDSNPKSLDLLVKNLSFCDKQEYELFKGDYTDCLRLLASRGVTCNVILCDPPYASGLTVKAMEKIEKSGLLKKDGVLISERLTDAGETDSPAFVCVDSKKFGKTSYDVFRNYTKCVVPGTFDPFTEGHVYLVESALKEFDFAYVCILVNPDKEITYSVEKRQKFIRLSLGEYKKRIRVDYYDGFTIDYCHKRGVKHIIRGVRNKKDEEYEKQLAEYNLKHGGVETIMYQASRSDVSSTEVKRRIKAGETVECMVHDNIISLLKTED